jgi:hypothetical protein
VATDQQYISLLVALDAAALLILAGLAKKQLDWKRPAVQPLSRRGRDRPNSPALAPLPGWMKAVLIAGICLGSAVAGGAGLAGAVSPGAVVSYLIAALFVVFATR